MKQVILAALAIAVFALGGCGSDGQLTAEDFSEGGAEPVAQTSQALTGATRYQAYSAGLPTGHTSTSTAPFVFPGYTGSGTPGICALDQVLGGFNGGGDAVWIDTNTTTGRWQLNASANSYGTTHSPSVEMVCAPLSNFPNSGNARTLYGGNSGGYGYFGPGSVGSQVQTYPGPEEAYSDVIKYGSGAQFPHSWLSMFAGVAGFLGDDVVYGSANAFAQLKTQQFSSLGGNYNVTDALHVATFYQPLNNTAPELGKANVSAWMNGILRNDPSSYGWSYSGAHGFYDGVRDVLASNRSGATYTQVALTSDATNNFCFITGVGRDFQDSNHAAKIVPSGAGYALAVFGTQTEATASCISYAQP